MPARRCLPAARAAMLAALDVAANPSSVHARGPRGAPPDRGGEAAMWRRSSTPSRSMSCSPPAPPKRRRRCSRRTGRWAAALFAWPALCLGGRSSLPAVRRALCQRISVTRIGVDADGVARSRRAGGGARPRMTGRTACRWSRSMPPTTRPASSSRSTEIAEIVKAPAASWSSTRCRRPDAFRSTFQRATRDYLILSSHKIGGPKGAGAIVAAADLMMPKPLVTGGGQEKGHRAGTENLAGDRRLWRGGARGAGAA